MSDFTYELPSEDGFFNAVMTVLGSDPKYSNKNYYNVLRDGYCEISATSSFSQRRWDAMYTIVNFYIPQNTFGANASNLADIKEVLLKVSRSVMPPNAGYDVMEINISPNLSTTRNNILEYYCPLNHKAVSPTF